MEYKPLFQAAVTLALVSASTAPWAQNFAAALVSPDLATAPLYPLAVPNNGQPLANLASITGFGRSFAFGSSSSNTRGANPGVTTGFAPYTTEVFSNGHAVYVELLSPLIGARNGRGSTFPSATNFADGGSNSVTALTGFPAGCTTSCALHPQITQFQQTYGRYAANDVVVQFSGINDFSAANSTPDAATTAATVARNVLYQTEMMRQNLALGAQHLVFLNLPDLGSFNYFTRAGSNNSAVLQTQGAQATNTGMLQNLVALRQQSGANIHYVDIDLLVRQVRANPTAYGFSAAGVQANASCVSLASYLTTGSSITACGQGSFADQNKYLSLDGIHYTYRFHDLLALTIANQMLAPNALAAQADLSQAASDGFADALGRRLSEHRGLGSASSPRARLGSTTGGIAGGSGLAAGDVAAGPYTLFVQALYARGKRADRLGATGMDYSLDGLVAGLEYPFSPSLLGGVALAYATPRADLNNGFGSIKADSYQVGGYLSWSQPDRFLDLTATLGNHELELSRPGLVSNLTASPESQTVSLDGKLGYLFALGGEAGDTPRLGPIAGASYRHIRVKAYNEQGDALLNQSVASQSLNSLIGRIGLGLRAPATLGRAALNPWLDITIEREFRDGMRNLTSALSSTPELGISTSVAPLARTFRRLAGGINANIRDNLSFNIGAAFTLGRQDSNERAVNLGLRLVW